MPGLDPAIHRSSQESLLEGWIAGTTPAMTVKDLAQRSDGVAIVRAISLLGRSLNISPVVTASGFR
jgi:hypothetical protein